MYYKSVCKATYIFPQKELSVNVCIRFVHKIFYCSKLLSQQCDRHIKNKSEHAINK